MIDVVAAGHLCVDIIPEISDASTKSDNFMAPGRLTEVGGAILSAGGSVANTGLALHRLGMEVRLLARLGDDLIANLIRDTLKRHDPKLTSELATGRGEPSSYTVVISPPGIDRTFLHCPGTNNTFGPEDLKPALLAQARLFHFGYPPLMRRMFADGGVELATLLRRAREGGATTSLDMAMPDPTRPSGKADWPGILACALPFVDIFMPSVEELLYMLERDRFEALRRSVGAGGMLDALTPDEIKALGARALALGTQVIVIKLGHRGLYLRSANPLHIQGRGAPGRPERWAQRELWAPCFLVDLVSAVGAGDSTIAGFLAALLRGQDPEEAITTAVAVGACNVEAADTLSGVRPWEATQERVRRGWAKLRTDAEPSNWRWDESAALWHGPDDAPAARA